MSDFNQLLDAVKGASISQPVSIYVPSINKNLLFKPLTAKQQKDLIKTAADKNLSAISFLDAINTTIANANIIPDSILVSDRIYVIVMLRALTMSATYKYKNTTYDLKALNNNKIPFPENLKTTAIVSPELSITCRIPTLKIDSMYNAAIFKNNTEKKSASDTLGDLFIYEVLKYIEKIESPISAINVTLSDLSILQQYQLLEHIPSIYYNQIVDYIDKINNASKELFKIGDEYIDIDLDQSFFTV
jgi:hypothetical protein